ncbi:TPR-like protein [Lojkania enalia]|uniref:TPR-like protein n=1 Tax=Lojkania enalia TaxID=147567 RepID=A0A9P4N6B8_9PLEO|nr:TPR-like protein [Didymosphaeria enalia]
MRLLHRNSHGDLTFTDDLHDGIPAYAILSHTWGKDEEEVTFRDMKDGSGRGKKGYKKIKFCGEQAARDGLQYFWVDTCCIDKTNNVELTSAINSMYRWYHGAARCYVYLADVHADQPGESSTWEEAFRKSRWFTRGWTLQELIAPRSVEFFSVEGDWLGYKTSLEPLIHNVTKIPVQALRGSLSEFSVEERITWVDMRITKHGEDMAYCLLGIVNVSLAVIYGEGKAKAIARLKRELALQSHISVNEVEARQYRVPFSLKGVPVINKFVNRKEELTALREHLLPAREQGRRKVTVLHGLGGIGKTQLSVEFCRRHADTFTAVFWLDGRSEDTLKQSLAAIAARLPMGQLPEASVNRKLTSEEDVDATVNDVLIWLSIPANSSWLLVFDNVDIDINDPKAPPGAYDVQRFYPDADHGSILVTTRLSSLAQLGAPIKVANVNRKQALAIFRNGYKYFRESPESDQLLEKLDGLPLALAQAAAYMSETQCSFTEYIELYDIEWNTWMNTNGDQKPVQAAICERDKDAANLLLLWSWLDYQDLWFELFAPAHLRLTSADEVVAEWFMLVTNSKPKFMEKTRLLLRYSLIDRVKNSGGYIIHPVMHEWAWQIQDKYQRGQNCQLAAMVLGLAVPLESEKGFWVLQLRLLLHANRYLKCLEISDGISDRRSRIGVGTTALDGFHGLGNLYCMQGKLAEAEKMYQRALEGKEKAWGPDHTSTLSTVNNLGNLYKNQGKLAEAEKMYQRALEGKEKAWGPDHTSTLHTVNNLGLLYADQGKLAEAEKIYQRALEGYEKAWGPDHTSTLSTVNNLGNLYADQGKLAEAEKMYQRALEGKEKAWGPDHTSTLDTVNNLGNLYADQGKLVEAEKIYQRALEGYEKAWGPDHTSTLSTVNNLGNLYKNQGKLAEAEKMYQRALEGKEKAWGPDHTSTLSTGKLAEAEKMYQRALEGYEKAWGPDHTSTLDTVNNLGLLYADQGKLAEAEKMYQRALEGKEKAWGPNHTSILDTVNNLGNLYADQGKLAEAEKMFQRALEGKEKAWGPDHASTLNTVNNLGNLYKDQGKLAEAEKMYQRALERKEKVWAPDHTSTLDTVNNLGLLYADQGKLAEAEKMYQRALEGYDKAWGPDHISTLDTVNNLGNLYADQGKLAEAEKMYQRVLEGYEKALSPDGVKTFVPALNNAYSYGMLFERQGRSSDAITMYIRALRGYGIVFGTEYYWYQAAYKRIHNLESL